MVRGLFLLLLMFSVPFVDACKAGKRVPERAPVGWDKEALGFFNYSGGQRLLSGSSWHAKKFYEQAVALSCHVRQRRSLNNLRRKALVEKFFKKFEGDAAQVIVLTFGSYVGLAAGDYQSSTQLDEKAVLRQFPKSLAREMRADAMGENDHVRDFSVYLIDDLFGVDARIPRGFDNFQENGGRSYAFDYYEIDYSGPRYYVYGNLLINVFPCFIIPGKVNEWCVSRGMHTQYQQLARLIAQKRQAGVTVVIEDFTGLLLEETLEKVVAKLAC